MLEALGISRLANRVYLSLLKAPDDRPEEIAEALRVEPQAVHDCLDELACASLVRQSSLDPVRVRPVSPDVGVAALLAREETEVARRYQQIEESRVALARLLAEQQEAEVSPAVEVLGTVDDVRDRMRLLSEGCTTDVRALVPTSRLSEESRVSSRELDRAALRRNVRMRVVYPESLRNDARSWEHALWQRDNGMEVRFAPLVPTRLLLVDGTHALVPLQKQQEGVGAMQVSSAGVVSALEVFFDQVWRSAVPLGVGRTRDQDGLSGQERELLQLWAHGATDERAARQLGLSLRTVRRLSAGLMKRLDAESRFQAGVRASERGWLNEADVS